MALIYRSVCLELYNKLHCVPSDTILALDSRAPSSLAPFNLHSWDLLSTSSLSKTPCYSSYYAFDMPFFFFFCPRWNENSWPCLAATTPSQWRLRSNIQARNESRKRSSHKSTISPDISWLNLISQRTPPPWGWVFQMILTCRSMGLPSELSRILSRDTYCSSMSRPRSCRDKEGSYIGSAADTCIKWLCSALLDREFEHRHWLQYELRTYNLETGGYWKLRTKCWQFAIQSISLANQSVLG